MEIEWVQSVHLTRNQWKIIAAALQDRAKKLDLKANRNLGQAEANYKAQAQETRNTLVAVTAGTMPTEKRQPPRTPATTREFRDREQR